MMNLPLSALDAGHECITVINDPHSGLKAVIAIHSTRLGPALGGCRALPYGSLAEAAADALRLSEAMTLKGAAAGLPFGGGKMTIMLPSDGRLSAPVIAAAGRLIERFNGQYITGEDVGTNPDIMRRIARETDHVLGLPLNEGGSGDPSPSTALGCYHGLTEAVKVRLGVSNLDGLRIAVQGLGHVGMRLCAHLAQNGAHLTVSDTVPARVKEAIHRFEAEAVDPSYIHSVDADVFAPCALGGVITARSVTEIVAPVVAGAANNQLAENELASVLARRQILYAPDFIVNAGGMIQLAGEKAHWDSGERTTRIQGIADTLKLVFEHADAEGIDTHLAACAIARAKLDQV